MTHTKVKICGIMDEAALQAAVAAGADYIGFVFVPASRRFISPQYAEKLSYKIHKPVKAVGLFADPSDTELTAVLHATEIDIIQLHGHETPARVAAIRQSTGLPVMKAIGIAEAKDLDCLAAYEEVADKILLDAKAPSGLSGGLGISFDWSLLHGVKIGKPWMLAGGLNPDNVAEAIKITGAPCVDASSGVEKFEVKDADLIRAFVQNAKHAKHEGRWR